MQAWHGCSTGLREWSVNEHLSENPLERPFCEMVPEVEATYGQGADSQLRCKRRRNPLRPSFHTVWLNFAQAKPVISPSEIERRRKHVKAAIADSRIEGYPPPSRPEKAILDAYIRGEIDAQDLVEVYKRRFKIAVIREDH